MIRTQIQLTEEQATRLRHLASERGVSMAELIRDAVDDVIANAPRNTSGKELRERARKLAGRFASGVPDLAAAHDAHLATIYSQ
jgi:predicted DNA-binding protein